MSGGSPQHAIISKNLMVALDPQIWRKGCQVHGSDMRVRVESPNLYTYPDVSVVCGKAHFDPKDPDVLRNPVLIAKSCRLLPSGTIVWASSRCTRTLRRCGNMSLFRNPQ